MDSTTKPQRKLVETMAHIDEQSFLQNFTELFEEVKEGEIQMATPFRQLGEWSSMHALMVIAMIDQEYHVTLDANILRQAQTVHDIYLATLQPS